MIKSLAASLLIISTFGLANSQSSVFDMGDGVVNTPKVQFLGEVEGTYEGVRQEDGSVLFEKREDGEVVDGEVAFDEYGNVIKELTPEEIAQEINDKFFTYLSQRNIVSLRTMLDEGFDVNTPLYKGNTALHLVAGYADVELLTLLLSYGGSLVQTNENKETPLHSICNFGTRKMLVTAKESLGDGFLKAANSEGAFKRNCLHYAVLNSKDKQMPEQALIFGVDMNKLTVDGKTPVHYAVYSENWDGLQTFINVDRTVMKMKTSNFIETKGKAKNKEPIILEPDVTVEDIVMEKMPILTKLSFFKYFEEDNQEKLDVIFNRANL